MRSFFHAFFEEDPRHHIIFSINLAFFIAVVQILISRTHKKV